MASLHTTEGITTIADTLPSMVSSDQETPMDSRASPPVASRDAGALPHLSVIIVNYQTKGLLKYCLRRFFASALPYAVEVIVVDNASNDGSAAMVRALYPQVQLIVCAKNRGFAAGNNEGLRRARGAYVLIMNADIVVRDGGIHALVQFLDTHPHVGIVGPRLLNPDGTLQYSCYRFPHLFIPLYRRTPLGYFSFARRHVARYCMEEMNHAVAHPVDWLLGACLLIRRNALSAVGCMDERYFLYFEDIDWCRRFWERGWEVWYAPQAALTHFHQRLSAEATGLSTLFSFATRAHIVSGIKYFWKWRHHHSTEKQ